MRDLLLLLVLLSGLGLQGCDLRHLPERMQCWEANDDWQACQELRDICTPYGGPECRGAEGSACASACLPSKDGTRCEVDFGTESSCGGHGFVSSLGVFNGPQHETGWNLLPLERELWEPRMGTRIDSEIFASMSARQRRAVCATTRTLDATGRSPCRLEWNAELDRVSCERLAAPCAECELVLTDFQCLSRNLCSDVICF